MTPSPDAGVQAAVGVESLGEQRGARLVHHLPHRAQPVGGEVLRRRAVALRDQAQPVQVGDRLHSGVYSIYMQSSDARITVRAHAYSSVLRLTGLSWKAITLVNIDDD